MASDQSPIMRYGGDPPSPWEGVYGYSRTVGAGPWVLIGGTTSVDPSGVVVGATPYEQAVEILRKLAHELDRLGLSFAEVVQTRMYVTDISRSEEVGRAHGEAFAAGVAGGGGPVTSMVEIELVAYRG